jgi:hypothetical protein
MRFQSFGMLITTQPFCLARAISASEKGEEAGYKSLRENI